MATNPYENPYQQQQQNPYGQPQQQQQQQQQPSWTGAAAGTTTSGGGQQTGSTYQQYAPAPWAQQQPKPQAQPQQQAWYGAAQPGSAPQGSYPFQYNYAQGQPPQQAWQQPQQPQGSQMPGGWPTGGQQPQAQPSTNWNTDGFTRPQTVAQRYAPHPMPGWDRAKWADPNHQTPKYVIGRLLSGIKPRTENMDQAVAMIAQAYPGTRRTGSGDITIPGIGTTDILKAADVGGKAWHFGSTSKKPPAKPGRSMDQGGPPGSAGYGGGQGVPAGAAADPYTQLLQSLMQPQQQMPQQQAAPAWEQSPQYQQMAAQMAQLQQQMQTWQQQAGAQQNQLQARGPQFSYY